MNTVNVNLTIPELESLIKWHQDRQYAEAADENYTEAAYHKQRIQDLKQLLQNSTQPWLPGNHLMPPLEDQPYFSTSRAG